jgi:hypothetical protein
MVVFVVRCFCCSQVFSVLYCKYQYRDVLIFVYSILHFVSNTFPFYHNQRSRRGPGLTYVKRVVCPTPKNFFGKGPIPHPFMRVVRSTSLWRQFLGPLHPPADNVFDGLLLLFPSAPGRRSSIFSWERCLSCFARIPMRCLPYSTPRTGAPVSSCHRPA